MFTNRKLVTSTYAFVLKYKIIFAIIMYWRESIFLFKLTHLSLNKSNVIS